MPADSFNQKKIVAFDALADQIKNWLISDTAAQIIRELNDKYEVSFGRSHILPRFVTRIATGVTNPENFTRELSTYLPFLEKNQIVEIAGIMKDRIFKPIAKPLHELGIDIERLTEYQEPQVPPKLEETKMNGVPPRTVNLKGAVSHGEQARTAPRPPVAPPKPQEEEADQPFHLVEQNPTPGNSQIANEHESTNDA